MIPLERDEMVNKMEGSSALERGGEFDSVGEAVVVVY